MKKRQGPTRRHRRKMERLTEQEKARALRAERPRKTSTWSARRALIATVVTVVLSITTAVPSQLQWFLDRLAGGDWSNAEAPVAVLATLLIEGLCWLGAFLYADSIATAPVRLYRVTTLVFASIAAGINFAHGRETDWKVGVVYALASLMGVGAFELYMHSRRHSASGMPLEEIRLWALRWRKHPRVMRECGRIVATFGTAVPREVAWRLAYVRKVGNPTVPIALTDALVKRLGGLRSAELDHLDRAEPASSGVPRGGVAVDAAEVVEVPIDWSRAGTFEELLAAYWPELDAAAVAGSGSVPDAPAESSGFRLAAPGSSGDGAVPPKPTAAAALPVTSTVPAAKRNRKPAVRTARTATRNSGRVQIRATKAELDGPGDAKARVVALLARAEREGHAIADLDRKFIAEQFKVSDRHVRNAIKAHNQEGN
ncbi:hypothetical protein ACWEOE_31665 [Amycolatopsis sp. NPDC004368]